LQNNKKKNRYFHFVVSRIYKKRFKLYDFKSVKNKSFRFFDKKFLNYFILNIFGKLLKLNNLNINSDFLVYKKKNIIKKFFFLNLIYDLFFIKKLRKNLFHDTFYFIVSSSLCLDFIKKLLLKKFFFYNFFFDVLSFVDSLKDYKFEFKLNEKI
jgi:hypothetical protein